MELSRLSSTRFLQDLMPRARLHRHHRDRAQASSLVVLERLHQLLAGVHDEGAIGGHRLADRQAAKHQHVELGTAALLPAIGSHRHHVTSPNTASWPMRTGCRLIPTDPDPASTYTSALKSARHGSRNCAPGARVPCSSAIGVWVMPGPSWPATSPAITRSSAPPSDELSSDTARPRMS